MSTILLFATEGRIILSQGLAILHRSRVKLDIFRTKFRMVPCEFFQGLFMLKNGWTIISIFFILFCSNLMSFQKREEGLMKINKLTINFQEGDLPSVHPHDLILHLRGRATGKLLFEGLTRVDENGKVRLAGAESLDVSQDRLCYTFTLRDNKWSDGSPVTATQYENAWKEAISPKSTCSRANLFYLIQNAEKAKKGEVPLDAVGVKAVDNKTLVVHLAYPSSFFLDLIALPICAPLIDPKKKDISSFNGPFMIDTWKKNDRLRLVRNPFFWNKNRVLFDEINVLMASDPSTIFNLYESGKVDWIGVPFSPLSSEQIQDLQTRNLLLSRPSCKIILGQFEYAASSPFLYCHPPSIEPCFRPNEYNAPYYDRRTPSPKSFVRFSIAGEHEGIVSIKRRRSRSAPAVPARALGLRDCERGVSATHGFLCTAIEPKKVR